jgi:hypothetical protein
MIQLSLRPSPGGSAPGQCHCSQRELLVSEPSSSAKQLVGSSNTSVWIEAESTSLNSPWFSQKRAVSVCSGSMTTRNFSLASAPAILARFGKDMSGLKPWHMYPFILP